MTPARYDPDLCFQQALSGLANQPCLHRVSYICHRGNSSALQPTRWPCLRPLLTIPMYVLHAPWLQARQVNMRKQLAAIAAADVTWVKCINKDTVSALSIWQRSCLYPCSISPDGSPMPMSNRTLSLALKHKLAYWDMLERHLPAALVLKMMRRCQLTCGHSWANSTCPLTPAFSGLGPLAQGVHSVATPRCKEPP